MSTQSLIWLKHGIQKQNDFERVISNPIVNLRSTDLLSV